MKTKIWFKMTSKSILEEIIFEGKPSYNEIDHYFEEKCGGVYQWGFKKLHQNIRPNPQP